MVAPIVFLPGLLCNHTVFGPQTENLSQNYPIIVSELTGHDTVTGLARQVLESAPARFTLVGLSMGGYVAFEVLRQDPARVVRLVLFDTSARADDDLTRRTRKGLIDLSRRGRFKGITQRLLPRLIHPDRLADAELTRSIMVMAEAIGRDAYLRQQTAILNRPDSRSMLAGITCPTLVVCGRQDALTPLTRSEEIAAGIRGAQLQIIEDSGHLTTLEKPDEVNRILVRWLDRTERHVPRG